MRVSIIVCVLTLAASGCSSTKQVSSLAILNRSIGSGPAIVHMKSGEGFEARRVTVGADSTRFLSGDHATLVAIPTNTVKSIQVTHHGGGALEGLVFGAFGGGLLFVTMRNSEYGLFGLVMIVVGGLGGVTYGAIAGHDYTYVFPQDTLDAKEAPVRTVEPDSIH
jgi:hypothetical protein